MRKIIFCFLFIAINSFCFSQSALMNVKGIYEGDNIYIQNSFSADGKSSCITKILVNGKPTSDTIKSPSFSVNLRSLGLKKGDSVLLKIFHKLDCKPQILHRFYTPKSAFEIVSIAVNKESMLVWKTKNEISKLPFTVQQYRWNKWVRVGKVEGKGGKGNEYSLKVPLHSGENQFRVMQVDASGQQHLSNSVKWLANIPRIIPVVKQKSIVFSKETMYELFDQEGNSAKRGISSIIDCSSLPKGMYYLNFDNQTIEFMINPGGAVKIM